MERVIVALKVEGPNEGLSPKRKKEVASKQTEP